MFFPVGLDQDEVRRTPWASYLLIGANVVVFLLFALGGVPAFRYGFLPADPEPARMPPAGGDVPPPEASPPE